MVAALGGCSPPANTHAPASLISWSTAWTSRMIFSRSSGAGWPSPGSITLSRYCFIWGPPSVGLSPSTRTGTAQIDSSVDLRDDHRRAARRELRDVGHGRLSFLRGHRALQVLLAVVPELGDAVVGRLAPVGCADHPAGLEPPDAGHLRRERKVRVGVVLLESRGIAGGAV